MKKPDWPIKPQTGCFFWTLLNTNFLVLLNEFDLCRFMKGGVSAQEPGTNRKGEICTGMVDRRTRYRKVFVLKNKNLWPWCKGTTARVCYLKSCDPSKRLFLMSVARDISREEKGAPRQENSAEVSWCARNLYFLFFWERRVLKKRCDWRLYWIYNRFIAISMCSLCFSWCAMVKKAFRKRMIKKVGEEVLRNRFTKLVIACFAMEEWIVCVAAWR